MVCVMDRDWRVALPEWEQQLPDCPDPYHPPNNIGGAIVAAAVLGMMLVAGLVFLTWWYITKRQERLVIRDRERTAALANAVSVEAVSAIGKCGSQIKSLTDVMSDVVYLTLEHDSYFTGKDYIATQRELLA